MKRLLFPTDSFWEMEFLKSLPTSKGAYDSEHWRIAFQVCHVNE